MRHKQKNRRGERNMHMDANWYHDPVFKIPHVSKNHWPSWDAKPDVQRNLRDSYSDSSSKTYCEPWACVYVHVRGKKRGPYKHLPIPRCSSISLFHHKHIRTCGLVLCVCSYGTYAATCMCAMRSSRLPSPVVLLPQSSACQPPITAPRPPINLPAWEERWDCLFIGT